ncbi:hypothetical protein H4R34_002889 [Dimargaris verticillata]|uniref:FAR-17a/AIG1-like protein n=1 Tax=Dimargaris verticillata TaxID=2761393 RepID=A0A9W8E8T7_9FUNG|nr:hypothetical protein H4R34_002889 [Dimargaris verticillata]
MYECVATFHVFVPLMYWIVLSRGFRSETPLISYCGIAPHSLNLVVVIIEEVLNRHHLHPSHAIVPLAVLLLYLAWSYVLYAIRHEYVYPFLDINVYHGFVALFLVAIALATVIVFFVQLYLHNRRDQWLRHRRQQLVSNRQMTDAALMSQT